MIGKLTNLRRLFGGEWELTFSTKGDAGKIFDKLKNFAVNVEIKKYNPKRSKDANSFCWALCSDIGKATRPPIPKEEVYRKAIRDVGSFKRMLIDNDALESFERIWTAGRIGWFIDDLGESWENPGYKEILAYYGTSVYDSAEMSLIIDYLIDEMQNMGLPIPASKEQEEMLAQWQARA